MLKNSKIFKLGGLVIALAMMLAVGAAVASAETTIVNASGFTYSGLMKAGMSGPGISTLQAALNSVNTGATTIVVDGAFGPATVGAVEHFQAAHGLTADGVVGPLTGAALTAATYGAIVIPGGPYPAGCTSNIGYSSTTGMSCAVSLTLPAGCTSTAGYSTTTGMACSTVTTLPAGCTSTAGYSSSTGAKCDGGTSVSTGPLAGGAGDMTATKTSTDVEDQAIEGQSTKVLGFKVEASDSDIAVKNVKITLENTDAPDSSYRLSNYADTVEVYMGSTLVGSADTADFSKSGYVYTKSIALSNAVVREGTNHKATFYVVVKASSNLDGGDSSNTWDVVASDFRFEDATGVVMTANSLDSDLSANDLYANFSFIDLATSGDVKLTISKGSSTPADQNVDVSESGSTADVLMLEFKLKAAGSDLSFDQITFALTGSVTGSNNLSTMLGDLSLMNGSDILASDPTIPGTDSGNVTFNLDNTFTIAQDSTETFRVYAKINRVDTDTLTSGDSLKVALAQSGIATEDVNGDVVSNETGAATGNTQTFTVDAATLSNMHWSVSSTGTIVDFFFTVDANNGDFNVLAADVDDSAAGTASITDTSGTPETTTKGILSKYSGDDVTAIGSTGFTVTDGDTTTFRVRYSLTGANGTWKEVTITAVAGQAVPSANQVSPTATLNVSS